MTEIDVVTFMEKNGRDFFYSSTERATSSCEVVEVSLEIPVRKTKLREIGAYCRQNGITLPEFFAEVLEGWPE